MTGGLTVCSNHLVILLWSNPITWCLFYAIIAFIGVAFTVHMLQWMRQRKRRCVGALQP